MGLAGKLRELRWRAAGHYDRPLPPELRSPVAGLDVLEIGGPSGVFGAGGAVQVYGAAAKVDCVQWSAQTVWHGGQVEGPFVVDGTPLGRMWITEDPDLGPIADGAYGAVVSSHVIEHLANPLRALDAWRRVSGDGLLVVVAPHKEGTFDHRRPVTTLEHMIADREDGTGEDDLTHLDETLALHDRSRDAEGPDPEAWAAKRRDNAAWHVLHHHVFTTRSLLELLDHAGVQVLAAQARPPHDVYVLGRFVSGTPANGTFLGKGAEVLRTSPFRIDRADASRPSASAPAAAR